MNLVKFIDNRFQELRIEEQKEDTKKEYSIHRDSETLALQSILKFWRTLLKWAYIPVVWIHYASVLMKFSPEPQPVLVELLKKNQEKDLKAKAKKVGMLQSVEKKLEMQSESDPVA